MFIEQKLADEVLVWTIHRTDRFNALGTSLATELAQCLTKLREQLTSARVLVIRATPVATRNGRIWIAGGDLKELASLSNPAQYTRIMSDVCADLERLPIPVVAVIEGAAIGGGAEFALASDVRIATADSSLDFRQLAIGLATGYGGAKRLVDLVGKGNAQRMLYVNHIVEASEAQRLGLFHEVVPHEHLEWQLDRTIAGLLRLHTPAFASQKRMLLSACHSADQERCRLQEQEEFLPLWRNPLHSKVLKRFDKI